RQVVLGEVVPGFPRHVATANVVTRRTRRFDLLSLEGATCVMEDRPIVWRDQQDAHTLLSRKIVEVLVGLVLQLRLACVAHTDQRFLLDRQRFGGDAVQRLVAPLVAVASDEAGAGQQDRQDDDRGHRQHELRLKAEEERAQAHAQAGTASTSRYPLPHTVSMRTPEPSSLLRRRTTCTSTVRML